MEATAKMENLKGGDSIYSPKISETLIPNLYKIAKQRGVPMTRLVNEIITNWLNRNQRKYVVMDE